MDQTTSAVASCLRYQLKRHHPVCVLCAGQSRFLTLSVFKLVKVCGDLSVFQALFTGSDQLTTLQVHWHEFEDHELLLLRKPTCTYTNSRCDEQVIDAIGFPVPYGIIG